MTSTENILDSLYNFFKQEKTLNGNYLFLNEINKEKLEEAEIKKSIKQKEMVPSDNLFVTREKEEWESCRSLDKLDGMINSCQKCPLGKTRTKFVFGVGNKKADIMFIGEAPGADEDEQGEPFVGRAGQLLNKILEALQWKRDEVYICNILKCRPPNNRDPLASEVELCEPYLKKQIEIIKPIIMISLGRIAAQTLLRKPNESLSNMRKIIHTYEKIPLFVTFHPAALLRNPNWKPDAWEDFKKIKSYYENAKKKNEE